MRKAFRYSLILHFALAIILAIKLPYFGKPVKSEVVVAVDIVKVAKVTNLKNTTKSSAAKTKPKSSARTKQKPQKKQKAVKPKKVTVKKTKIKPIKTPNSPNTTKTSNNTPNDELENLLTDLEGNKGIKSPTEKDNNKEDKNLSTKMYNESLPLSISEKDSIKSQIEKKFVNPVVLDFKPQELVIKLRLIMNIDGSINNILALKSSVYSQKYLDTFTTLKNSLIRAAHIASPLQGLPKSKYHGQNGWHEIELIFDAYHLMNIG